MDNLYKKSYSTRDLAIVSASVGGICVLVALAIKSLFSQNITLELLDAKLAISNERLDIAQTASKTQSVVFSTESIVQQLKYANLAHAETQELLNSCQSRIAGLIPNEDFAELDPPTVQPVIPTEDLEALDRELQQTRSELAEEIEQIFEQ